MPLLSKLQFPTLSESMAATATGAAAAASTAAAMAQVPILPLPSSYTPIPTPLNLLDIYFPIPYDLEFVQSPRLLMVNDYISAMKYYPYCIYMSEIEHEIIGIMNRHYPNKFYSFWNSIAKTYYEYQKMLAYSATYMSVHLEPNNYSRNLWRQVLDISSRHYAIARAETTCIWMRECALAYMSMETLPKLFVFGDQYKWDFSEMYSMAQTGRGIDGVARVVLRRWISQQRRIVNLKEWINDFIAKGPPPPPMTPPLTKGETNTEEQQQQEKEQRHTLHAKQFEELYVAQCVPSHH